MSEAAIQLQASLQTLAVSSGPKQYEAALKALLQVKQAILAVNNSTSSDWEHNYSLDLYMYSSLTRCPHLPAWQQQPQQLCISLQQAT